MPRQPTTYQFDLFSNPHDAEDGADAAMAGAARRDAPTLTKLMVRLILDHVDGEHARATGGGAS